MRYVFGSIASTSSPIATALRGRGEIDYVVSMNEEIAGLMALGYGQASGRASVLSLSGATGLMNGLSSLYAAQRCRIPMVAIAIDQDSEMLSDEQPLGGNLLELARPLTKWSCELRAPSQISRQIRRAFHEALSPPKGPVLIACPRDLLLKGSTSPSVHPPHTSPLGAADPGFCKKAAKALVSAKRPCVIVGNEVSLYRARKQAVSLVEVLGCPAFSEPMPVGVNFPNRHPQFAGVLPLEIDRASQILSKFDVVLVLGMQTRVAARSDQQPLLSPSSIIIQLNHEASLAGRTLACDLSATADISETLCALRAEIQLVVESSWVHAAKQRAISTIAEVGGRRCELDELSPFPNPDAKIPMIWLLRLLDAVRPARSTVVCDLFCDSVNPFEVLTLEGSSDYFSSNAGVGGYAVCAVQGVQLAHPEGAVICLTTDESALCSPQALWTAAHHGMPIKFIVLNTMGRAKYASHLIPSIGAMNQAVLVRPEIRMTSYATAVGIPSSSVSTILALEQVLQKVFESPGAYFLDVQIDENA